MAKRTKKHTCLREPNGRLQRTYEPAWTPETMAKRVALCGAENARQPEAGEALGQAFFSGMLGMGDVARDRETAGRRYAALHSRWRAMAGIRPRELTQPGTGQGSEIDADEWGKVRVRFAEAHKAVEGAGRASFMAIEMVVIDNITVFPGAMIRGGIGFTPADVALQVGLDALAEHFGIVRRQRVA